MSVRRIREGSTDLSKQKSVARGRRHPTESAITINCNSADYQRASGNVLPRMGLMRISRSADGGGEVALAATESTGVWQVVGVGVASFALVAAINGVMYLDSGRLSLAGIALGVGVVVIATFGVAILNHVIMRRVREHSPWLRVNENAVVVRGCEIARIEPGVARLRCRLIHYCGPNSDEMRQFWSWAIYIVDAHADIEYFVMDYRISAWSKRCSVADKLGELLGWQVEIDQRVPHELPHAHCPQRTAIF